MHLFFSDNFCRVFTQSIDRQADTEELAQFEESLANFKVAVQDIGDIKKSELPDKTFLLIPGKRDGQTVMVRDGEKVLCYNWSSGKNEWEAVGEVVGSAGASTSTSGKSLYQGTEYDYVFDVELDVGMLKLPYNRGEDPWVVAQEFIHRHEIPQDYLNQIANFIIKNADVSSLSLGNNSYFDPFTGGSRYIPSCGEPSNNPRIDYSSEKNRDTASTKTLSQYFPQKIPLKFETLNKVGILEKLETSNALVSDSLRKEELEQMVEAVISPNVEILDLAPLEKALRWPPERVWPVLDVLRLALRSEKAQDKWLSQNNDKALIELLMSYLKTPSPLPTQLLAIRCLANMALHNPGKRALTTMLNFILPSLVSLAPYPNKNMEIAIATLLLNYATIFTGHKELENHCQLLSATETVVLNVSDPEAQFRILVAIGTLLTHSKDIKLIVHSLNIEPIIERLAQNTELPKKVTECARQILNLLK